MPATITDKIRQVAESVARGYARRCGPYADVADLTQEAWAVCLSATKNFDAIYWSWWRARDMHGEAP
jgi:DNA-directed RNA polymerase specialized sigma24 family protein